MNPTTWVAQLLAACEALSAAYPEVKPVNDCPCGLTHPAAAMVKAEYIVTIRAAVAKARRDNGTL